MKSPIWSIIVKLAVSVFQVALLVSHSFSDRSLSEECGCVQDIVTTATPVDDTTTNQIESTTLIVSTTETTSSNWPLCGRDSRNCYGDCSSYCHFHSHNECHPLYLPKDVRIQVCAHVLPFRVCMIP